MAHSALILDVGLVAPTLVREAMLHDHNVVWVGLVLLLWEDW